MVAAASNTRALDRGAGLHRGRAALTHPSLPHAPAAMSQEGKAQGWGRNGKCRSVQNRSSGETRWRGAGGRVVRAVPGRARAWDPAGNQNPETSTPQRAEAQPPPAWSHGLHHYHSLLSTSVFKALRSRVRLPWLAAPRHRSPAPLCTQQLLPAPTSLAETFLAAAKQNTGPFPVPVPPHRKGEIFRRTYPGGKNTANVTALRVLGSSPEPDFSWLDKEKSKKPQMTLPPPLPNQ